jgi:hypothetical protein
MSKPTTNQLVGRWITDPTDDSNARRYGSVSMQFSADGNLTYTLHTENENRVMLLTYRVDGETIVSNQPSNPRQERTRFTITPDGKLVLTNNGIRTRYIKAGKE